MTVKTLRSQRAPLLRLAKSLAVQHLLIILIGGLLTLAAYKLLEKQIPMDQLRLGAATLLALSVQIITMALMQRSILKRQLTPIDQALETLADLDTSADRSPQSIAQHISARHKALQDLQSVSAQSLLDAKLVGVKLGQLERVLDTLPFGVLAYDAEGRIVAANTAVSPLLGVQHTELLNKTLNEWSDQAELTEHVSEHFDKKTHSRTELVFSHPDRPDRWLQVSTSAVLFADVDGWVSSITDISDEVQAKKARGEFVTSLSHELKTPLHTMSLYAELLSGPDGADEHMRLDATNVINDEIERVNSLISNLLDSTRIEAGTVNLERVRVRLPELLQDSLDRVRGNIQERQLTLVTNIPESIAPVFIDKTMFSVVLNNLLSNAIKYNRDNGSVRVDLEDTDTSILIRVADTGLGIPEADLPHIFDKFYRASNVDHEGHGVGLSLARDIVQQHYGQLDVTSIEGKGTTFSILLNKSAILTGEAA